MLPNLASQKGQPLPTNHFQPVSFWHQVWHYLNQSNKLGYKVWRSSFKIPSKLLALYNGPNIKTCMYLRSLLCFIVHMGFCYSCAVSILFVYNTVHLGEKVFNLVFVNLVFWGKKSASKLSVRHQCWKIVQLLSDLLSK